MDRKRLNNLRLAGLLAFVGLMPLLALPVVNRRVDRWVFGGETLTDELAKIRGKAVEVAARIEGNKASPSEGSLTSLAASNPLAGPSPPPPIDLQADGLTSLPSPIDRLPPVEPAFHSGEYDAMQKRLQQLGASYFCLEDTGLGGARYRFRCEMPLPGSESYSRPFEHEHADPLAAMRHVVREVEAWVAAQRATVRRAAHARGSRKSVETTQE